MGALRRDGKTFVVALLACGWPSHKTYKWSDTRTLMEYGLAHYDYRSFDDVALPAGATADVLVSGGQGSRIGGLLYMPVETAADEAGVEGLLMHEDEKVTVTLQKVRELSAPVRKGQTVGYISYAVGNQEWKRIRLVAAGEIEAVDLAWCVRRVLGKWMISGSW